MEGAAPNLEKMYEQKYSKKMSKSLLMLLGLYKRRDRQLVGLMNKAVIPIQLVQAKNWYQHRIKNAKSPRFGAVMKGIYMSMISPLVDAFMPYPVPIDTLLKDYATDQGEIEVVGTPRLPKKKKGKKPKNDEEEEEDFFEKWAGGDNADEEIEDGEVEEIDLDMMEKEKQLDLDKLEEDLLEEAGRSFKGPFEETEDGEGEESPFLSLRRADDQEEE